MVDCGPAGERRPTPQVGDEVVLLGRQGDGGRHRRGVGGAPRHHRLRDRLRHRSPGAAPVPPGSGTVERDHRGRGGAGRALDRSRGPHRVHRRAVARRHGRDRARCGAVRLPPGSWPARAGPDRRAARRRRAHRRLGLRAGGRRRRDALVRGAGPGVPHRRRAGADRADPGRSSTCSTATARCDPGPRRGTRHVWRPTPAPSSWVGWAPGPDASSASGRGVSTPAPAVSARRRSWHEGVTVAALVAVNAVGDRRVPGDVRVPVPPTPGSPRLGTATNTTIGSSLTDARLTKLECHLAAQSAHDGLPGRWTPPHGGRRRRSRRSRATAPSSTTGGADRAVATAYAVEAAVLDALDRAEAAGPSGATG